MIHGCIQSEVHRFFKCIGHFWLFFLSVVHRWPDGEILQSLSTGIYWKEMGCSPFFSFYIHEMICFFIFRQEIYDSFVLMLITAIKTTSRVQIWNIFYFFASPSTCPEKMTLCKKLQALSISDISKQNVKAASKIRISFANSEKLWNLYKTSKLKLNNQYATLVNIWQQWGHIFLILAHTWNGDHSFKNVRRFCFQVFCKKNSSFEKLQSKLA